MCFIVTRCMSFAKNDWLAWVSADCDDVVVVRFLVPRIGTAPRFAKRSIFAVQQILPHTESSGR